MQKNSKNLQWCPATITAQAIFKHYDLDKNGVLDRSELIHFLSQISEGHPHDEKEELSSKLFKIGDENGDNKLSMKELISLLSLIFEYKNQKKE